MPRFIFTSLFILCFAVQFASCQEASKSSPLDDAKTAEQVEAYLSELAQKLRADVKDVESYEKFLQTMGERSIASGEKLLAIAKDDEEREKAYIIKITGLKTLIRKDQQTSQTQKPPTQKTENVEKLAKLIDELEKEGKYLLLVNGERFQEFVQGIRQEFYLNASIEKFEKVKKEAMQWVNKKPVPFEPVEPLLLVVRLAGSGISKDEQFTDKTVKELVAFVNSPECTISDTEKKATVDRLEGFSRRSIGSELKLYGKTLDGKDFDWPALRGKYVLVKFTASWCGPCKGEIPGMLEAYKKYHDKGLEIVSVYVWDKLADSKRAVEEEKLPWLIVSEELTEKANQPPQGKMYCIEGVPTMLLIDKDGKVIATDVRGEKLKTTLAELFAK